MGAWTRFRVWRGKKLRQLLLRRGFDLIKAPHLGSFLAMRSCDLVIDVGGNIGQFGSHIRYLGYRGRIISFEPVADSFRKLSAVVDENWTPMQLALGRAAGTTFINVSADPCFSSIKNLTQESSDLFAISRVVEREEIRVERLDDVLDFSSFERPFLKIDTQGFEREVLAGASETLARAIGILIELPVVQLYEDGWSLASALDYFDSLGFEPSQIRPVSMSPKDPASAVEFDFLFKRR